MKYKISLLFLLFFSLQTFSACINTSKKIFPALHSIGPVRGVIKTGMVTTITESGSYHILENIVGNIIVNADDVFIDLNGFTITGVSLPGASSGVITVTADQKNIVITNGSIHGFDRTLYGVNLEKNTQTVVLKDLNITNALSGIYFAGESGNEIKCCKVVNCFVTDSTKAFEFVFTNNSVFQDCDNILCTQVGFDFLSCKYNKIIKCKSVRVGGDGAGVYSAVGFKSTAGTDNLFYECRAEGIYKEYAEFGTEVTGFLFDGTSILAGETESKIINCLVDSISVGYEAAPVAYGIHLNMVLKDPIATCPFLQENINQPITDVSWSPVGDKIAISTLIGELGGTEYQRIKILQFDCCAWSEIKTLTNANINHLEWDPTGRYLAMGGSFIAGAVELNREVKVFDTVYGLEYYGQRVWNPAQDAQVYNPVWSRDGKYLSYTVNNVSQEWLVVYGVGDSGLTLLYSNDFGISATIRNHAISSDEKLLAFGASNSLYVYNWSFLPQFLGTALGATPVASDIGSITDVAFSPTGCCGLYIVVAVGDKGTGTGNIQVFLVSDDGIINDNTVIDFGDDVLRVKFSPNGEYFAVLGKNGTMGIYKVNPYVDTWAQEVYKYSLGFQIDTGGLDWSPSGRYVAFGGDVLVEAPDFAILEVANVPTKNVICNNKVANVSGGLCSVGIEGASCCNGIMKNIVYNACVSYSRSVLDVWYDGLVGIDQNHINLAVPTYGVLPSPSVSVVF